MMKRIEHFANQIGEKNKDIVLYAKHVIKALDDFEDYHRKFVAAQAIAGIRPDGEQEQVFYETVKQIKEQLVLTLEQTIEDLNHKGDKHYEKHFVDGVE